MATKRVQMDLPDKSYERLKQLKEKVEATSFTEVLKDAIRLYDFFVEKESSGSKFFIEEKDKAISELKLFI